ncbi:MAG: TonB-dependent receptor [Cyclobacteriaceae bacterium]|nr:TonB-dependent receptor [Cyclobacteriaceae bacterium]
MKNKILQQLIMLSKLIIYGTFLQCMFMGVLLASNTNAQKIKTVREVYIKLESSKVPVKEIFREIESTTNFLFSFYPGDFNEDQLISISNKKQLISDVLLQVSKETNLSFRQINNNINVRKKEDSKPESTIEVIIEGIKITGKVVSGDDNEGLPGVNVIVKGTTQGTVTDVEGNYELQVPDENSILVFSSVGFISEEVALSGRSVVDMMLTPDITALEEIVVIGYGSRSKRDITTSISNIQSEEITKSIGMSPELSMQGRMTGVQVSGNDGNPMSRPTVRIRGVNTWGVSSPLYVIDGIPITEYGSGIEGQEDARASDVRGPLNIMSMIDPNDIESMSVLKDASAAAIYGVRAANGVILITTKKGRGDTPKVEFSGRFGIQNVTQEIDVLNTSQYTQHVQNVYASDPTESRPVENEGLFDPNSDKYLGNSPTYNWQDALKNKNAPVQDYSIRISGGTEKTDYYVSAGYASTEGTMIGNYLNRYSGSFKMNTQINKYIKAGVNYRIATAEGSDIWSFNFWQSAQTPPWQPITDSIGPGGYAPVVGGLGADGVYRSDKLYGVGTRINGIGRNEFTDVTYKSLRNIGVAYVELEPVLGLKIKGSVSLDTYSNTRFNFFNFKGNVFDYTRGDPRSFGGGTSVGTYEERDTYNNNLIKELTINYQKSIKDHNFDVLLSVMDQQYNSKYKAGSTEYMTSVKEELRKLGGENKFTNVQSDMGRWALVGQLARIGYNYQSKYYLDATVRRDGSARFAPENRWGIFPSVSGAYRISNESFFAIPWISDLKIRAGWGKLGNQEVRDLAYLSPIDTRPSFAWGNNDNNGYGFYNTAAAIYGIANSDLVWESTATSNVGFDAVLFDGLNMSFEYYNKITEGILQEVTIPTSVGVIDQPVANIASVRNSGFELSLNYTKNIGDFIFNVGGNFTTVKNSVEKTYNDIPLWTIEEGYPINYIRGFKKVGTFQTQEEVDEWLANYKDDSYQSAKVAPGDFYFEDVRSAPEGENEFYSDKQDSLISFYDQVYLGKTIPGFFYGINLGAQWKGFDFTAQFTGVGDVQKYNEVKAAMEYTPGMGNNLSTTILGSWTAENPNTDLPRVIAGDPANNFRRSDHFVESGAYFRASYMALGYTFPQIESLGISNLRMYVGSSNLFTITPYSGLDPESDNYPTPQAFFMGVNLRF